MTPDTGVNGIEATRRILHTSPHISILVISMFEDDVSVFAALRAGARGYLLKGAPKAQILRAIGGGKRRSSFWSSHRQTADAVFRQRPACLFPSPYFLT